MDQEKLLEKWLSGELSQAEQEDFKNLDDYKLNTQILEGAKQFKASHFSSVDNFDVFKARLNVEKKPVIKLNAYKVLYRIAAVLVVGLGLYFSFFNDKLTTVQTLASNQTTFELPDASSVTLNADSKAAYSKKKWSNKREVSLDGEAFFKVAKGSKFDVVTVDGIVSVLGTQFIVKNRDNYFEVKCFEGIVSVNSKGKTERLTKGKTFRIVNNEVSLDITNNNEPEWINNKSSFKSVPLYEVLNELERQYNITFEVKDIDTNRMFTGGFVHNNLEQALESITVPLDLSVKKNNSNKITIYSSK